MTTKLFLILAQGSSPLHPCGWDRFRVAPSSLQVTGSMEGIVTALPGRRSSRDSVRQRGRGGEAAVVLRVSPSRTTSPMTLPERPSRLTSRNDGSMESVDLATIGNLVLAVTGTPLNSAYCRRRQRQARGREAARSAGHGLEILRHPGRRPRGARHRCIAGPIHSLYRRRRPRGSGEPGRQHRRPSARTEAHDARRRVDRWIERRGSGYELYRNGKPFWIKGAGGRTHFDKLAAAGGNTVRLWGTDGAQPLMDMAYSNGTRRYVSGCG